MAKGCRVPLCPNAAGRLRPAGPRPSFHRFPLADAARLRLWLAPLRMRRWMPSCYHHLCSDHFEPSCFQMRWGVRRLRPDAIPTIFPGIPSKHESPSTELHGPRAEQPLLAGGTSPVTPGWPPSPEATVPATGISTIPIVTKAVTPPHLEHVPAALATDVTTDVATDVTTDISTVPSVTETVTPLHSECVPTVLATVVSPALPIVSTVPNVTEVVTPLRLEPIPAAPATIDSTVPIVTEAVTPLRLECVPVVPATTPATVTSPVPAEPVRWPAEPSTRALVAAVRGLQRKVKGLQQRQRRHRARLRALETLLERLLAQGRPQLWGDSGDAAGDTPGGTAPSQEPDCGAGRL